MPFRDLIQCLLNDKKDMTKDERVELDRTCRETLRILNSNRNDINQVSSTDAEKLLVKWKRLAHRYTWGELKVEVWEMRSRGLEIRGQLFEEVLHAAQILEELYL